MSLLSFDRIVSFTGDNGSATVLAQGDDGRILLFHFLSGDPEGFVAKCLDQIELPRVSAKRRGSITSASPFLSSTSRDKVDEATWNVLAGFSRVTNLYTSLIGRALGMVEEKRPRRITDDGSTAIRNPWILEKALELPPSHRIPTPISASLSAELDGERLWDRIYLSGSNPDDRAKIWRCLFGIAPEGTAEFAKDSRMYEQLLQRATADLSQECRNRIHKDVFRTDRSIEFFHPDVGEMAIDVHRGNLGKLNNILSAYAIDDAQLGYVQGMNDILSPILYVMKEEMPSYLIFKQVMSRQRFYFLEHQQHVQEQLNRLDQLLRFVDPLLHDHLQFCKDSSQLYFCYRWLLLLFKREVGFYQFPLILETIMTAPIAHYELILALSLIIENRQVLCKGSRFDQILSYFNEKGGSHDVQKLLDHSDQLYQFLSQQRILRSDPKLAFLFELRMCNFCEI